MDKNKIIEHAYNYPRGFGPSSDTLKGARKIDKSITYDDAKKWIEQNIDIKTQLKCFSLIA